MSAPLEVETIVEQLRHFAQAHLLAPNRPLEVQTPLAQAGIDSYSLVELLLFSERTFGVVVPDSHLTQANLATLAALARCVAELARERELQPQQPN